VGEEKRWSLALSSRRGCRGAIGVPDRHIQLSNAAGTLILTRRSFFIRLTRTLSEAGRPTTYHAAAHVFTFSAHVVLLVQASLSTFGPFPRVPTPPQLVRFALPRYRCRPPQVRSSGTTLLVPARGGESVFTVGNKFKVRNSTSILMSR
jgi:hypothetical protein